jgi:hypothetical protein
MPKYTTSEEGVMKFRNQDGSLKMIVEKDPVTHNNIFYMVEKAQFEDLKDIFQTNVQN